MSNSVGEALLHYEDVDATETARFVKTFDRFFDMPNTRSIDECIYRRKPDLAVLRTAIIVHTNSQYVLIVVVVFLHVYVQWLKEDFLGYLQEWDTSVEQRTGDFTEAERKKMRLSDETLEGLRMTGIS